MKNLGNMVKQRQKITEWSAFDELIGLKAMQCHQCATLAYLYKSMAGPADAMVASGAALRADTGASVMAAGRLAVWTSYPGSPQLITARHTSIHIVYSPCFGRKHTVVQYLSMFHAVWTIHAVWSTQVLQSKLD